MGEGEGAPPPPAGGLAPAAVAAAATASVAAGEPAAVAAEVLVRVTDRTHLSHLLVTESHRRPPERGTPASLRRTSDVTDRARPQPPFRLASERASAPVSPA